MIRRKTFWWRGGAPAASASTSCCPSAGSASGSSRYGGGSISFSSPGSSRYGTEGSVPVAVGSLLSGWRILCVRANLADSCSSSARASAKSASSCCCASYASACSAMVCRDTASDAVNGSSSTGGGESARAAMIAPAQWTSDKSTQRGMFEDVELGMDAAEE